MAIEKAINKKLGELLIERGIINQGQLNTALGFQKDKGGLIGEILVELGFIKEEEIAHALTVQYGFPYLSLSNYDISPEVVDLIPVRVAKQYFLMPIDRVENNLTIAMSNPLNVSAIEDVEFLSGCSVQVFVTTSSEIKKAIEKYYSDKE